MCGHDIDVYQDSMALTDRPPFQVFVCFYFRVCAFSVTTTAQTPSQHAPLPAPRRTALSSCCSPMCDVLMCCCTMMRTTVLPPPPQPPSI